MLRKADFLDRADGCSSFSDWQQSKQSGPYKYIKTNRRYLHENRKPSMKTTRTAYLRLNIEKSVNGNPTAPV